MINYLNCEVFIHYGNICLIAFNWCWFWEYIENNDNNKITQKYVLMHFKIENFKENVFDMKIM